MKRGLVVFVLGILFLVGGVSGVIIYVSTTGSDSSSCGSSSSPCRHIEYAVEQSAK
jgi:hypothetical protein